MDTTTELWQAARPMFHAHFRFWPDHEDLIWAKSIWPTFLDCGLFSDQNKDAEAWTRRNIQALALLYAASADALGTPTYRRTAKFAQLSRSASFGSRAGLEEALEKVGQSICFAFPENQTFVGDPAFFRPLIRSLVCGAGFFREGDTLEDYLDRASATHFQSACDFNEPKLRRMWIGGHFASESLGCMT